MRRSSAPTAGLLVLCSGSLLFGSLLSGCTSGIQAGPSTPSPSGTPSGWLLYQGEQSSGPDPDQLQPGEVGGPDVVETGTFLPYRPGATAITYDPAVVPPGARARVAITRTPAGLIVRLTVAGMVPRRAYGVHLRTQPCTAVPDQAGPHYQHQHDPRTPSVDPSYANPRNEVWLDFTADAAGAATAVSQENWTFTPNSPPRSLVIHAATTRTGTGEAGTAGARAACLSL
jgi:superoxide dismutase, Cu-Zn family